MRDLLAILVRLLRTAPSQPQGKSNTSKLASGFQYSTFKELSPFVSKHWKKALISGALTLGAALLSLPQPFLSKYVVDEVLVAGKLRWLAIIMPIMALLLVSAAFVSLLQGFYFFRLQRDIVSDIQQELFNRLFRLPKSFYDSRQTGYLMSRITGDVFNLQALFTSSIALLIPNVVKLLGGIFLLLYLNWKLAVLSFLFLPLFLVLRVLKTKVRTTSETFMERTALFLKDLHQCLSAITVIKTFAAEKREKEKLTKTLHSSIQANVEQYVISSFSSQIVMLISSLGLIFVLCYGAWLVVKGEMTIGEFTAFNAYLAYLYNPFQMLSSMTVSLQPAFAALERVLEILKVVPEDKDDEGKQKVTKLNGEIVFDKVSFSYGDGLQAVTDVSFTAKPGEMIAIVGPSGAGKSTLMSLIIRLYKPASGEILLDGFDITSLNLRSVRERIGIVSQDVFLFDDTIGMNIRYGRLDASEREIQRAAQMAAAHEFITQMPLGYETQVGERGVKLSAGQRQRISIARAILKDPDILIFDEPTSALDATAETAIKETINVFHGKKTIFVVAHRLSTVISADKILVMHNGSITQSGKHKELMRQDGPYRTLANSQIYSIK